MALRRAEQRVQRLPHLALARAKTRRDVLGDVLVAEAAETNRHRRAVQRRLLVLEELLHQPGLGAGKDVRGDVALELDVAPEDPVERRHLAHVLELVERDQRPEAAGFLEPQRQVEQRVQRRQRVGLGFQLKPRADPERAEREPKARLLEELLDAAPDRAPQLLRVCTLEADGHIGERDDAVQVNEHRHEPLLLLAVRENSPEQARLAVLARRVEPDVVAADRVLQQVLRLLVAVDDLLGRDRPRVDERVDVGDHGSRRIPVGSPSGYRAVSRQTTSRTPTGRHP